MKNQKRPPIDPDRIAYYEKTGWEANYDRNWPLVFRLMVSLNRAGFGMSLPSAIAAALATARAAAAFAPLEGNDLAAALHHLEGFFRRARVSLGSASSAAELAALELDYWVVHRELAIERRGHPETVMAEALDDIEPMVNALARLHAAMFNSDPATMRPSGEFRALAAKTVDRITGRYSEDIPADWQQVEEYLRRAYREIEAALPDRERVPA